MILSIDTNIFLYSLNPSSQWHSASVQFLEQSFNDKLLRVALTDYVLVELYVNLRNPAVMLQPLTAEAARNLVTSYLKIPNVMRIESANIMDSVWAMAGSTDFARRQIFDARLALTLLSGGVTHFATAYVKDFEGFTFDKVWNPLMLP
jgi:uncharacterized protein